MNKIKVCWELKTENNDGYYDEENPEAEYPREVYFPPTWTTKRYNEIRKAKDIKKIFDEQDGDCDFSKTILFICDMDDKLLFAYDRHDNREQCHHAIKRLIENLTNEVE